MISFFLRQPPVFYAYAIGVLLIAFTLVRLGHRILALLRDVRDFRRGH